MAEFHVYMFGLISHIGEDNDTAGKFKKHAALIHDEDHQHHARICIRGTDLERRGADVLYSIQHDDEITFSLPGGIAETDPVFQGSIPHLGFITDGGKLHGNVKSRKKHDHVLAYLVYPAGELTIARMFPKTGRYVFPPGKALDNPHCIGEIVDFRATTNNPVVVTITNPKNKTQTYEVKAAGKICVINDSHLTSGHHLDHHRKLTGAPQIARVITTNNKCNQATGPDCFCQNPDGPNPDGGDPECGNSQWP